MLNRLTKALGIRRLRKLYPVILTDNGRCFKNALALEYTKSGSPRTKIFYCDPQQTNQKSRLERNHEYIRYCIPKGKKMYWLTEEKVRRIMNHINGAIRASLNNHSPYDVALVLKKREALDKLGLQFVSPDNVQLNPALLK